MAKILLLDDERALLRILARTLERAGHSVVMAATGREALAAAENQDFEILVTDLKLAHESGLLVAQQLRALQPEIGVLVLTAYASVPSAVEAMRL
ncbi:MAG TPA: response regulator, partial [Acidiferrobacteraceae bacterium]|nr:response regulator [Acidiferrobacteraceae bacterium]